jgi:ATP-dependent Clp protease ATP-binding subunit ClpA
VTLDAVRQAATGALPAAAEAVPELVPFDAASRKVLEVTFREALRLGHNYIGTEHVLLALLEIENGAGVLTGLGVGKAAAETSISTAVAARLADHEQGADQAD